MSERCGHADSEYRSQDEGLCDWYLFHCPLPGVDWLDGKWGVHRVSANHDISHVNASL